MQPGVISGENLEAGNKLKDLLGKLNFSGIDLRNWIDFMRGRIKQISYNKTIQFL